MKHVQLVLDGKVLKSCNTQSWGVIDLYVEQMHNLARKQPAPYTFEVLVDGVLTSGIGVQPKQAQ